MLNRVLVAILLLPIVAAGFLYESLRWMPVLLLLVLGIGAIYELAALARRTDVHLMRRVATVVTVFLVWIAYLDRNFGQGIYVLALAVPATFLLRIRSGDGIEGALRDTLATLGAVLYIGLPVASMTKLLVQSDVTRIWLLMLLFIVWLTDTVAMLAGKRFGRHKMTPQISPNKTWEGSLGGLIGALLAVVLIWIFFAGQLDVSWFEMLVIGAIFGVLAQLGDLSESLLKRDVGVKDSGRMLGKHGGALDRMDALLIVAPAFHAYLAFFPEGIF